MHVQLECLVSSVFQLPSLISLRVHGLALTLLRSPKEMCQLLGKIIRPPDAVKLEQQQQQHHQQQQWRLLQGGGNGSSSSSGVSNPGMVIQEEVASAAAAGGGGGIHSSSSSSSTSMAEGSLGGSSCHGCHQLQLLDISFVKHVLLPSSIPKVKAGSKVAVDLSCATAADREMLEELRRVFKRVPKVMLKLHGAKGKGGGYGGVHSGVGFEEGWLLGLGDDEGFDAGMESAGGAAAEGSDDGSGDGSRDHGSSSSSSDNDSGDSGTAAMPADVDDGVETSSSDDDSDESSDTDGAAADDGDDSSDHDNDDDGHVAAHNIVGPIGLAALLGIGGMHFIVDDDDDDDDNPAAAAADGAAAADDGGPAAAADGDDDEELPPGLADMMHPDDGGIPNRAEAVGGFWSPAAVGFSGGLVGVPVLGLLLVGWAGRAVWKGLRA